MAQNSGSNLNPNTMKNFTPKEFLPQPNSETVVVEFQRFFEYQKFEDVKATPQNGFNSNPTRTPEFVSSIFG